MRNSGLHATRSDGGRFRPSRRQALIIYGKYNLSPLPRAARNRPQSRTRLIYGQALKVGFKYKNNLDHP